MKKNRLNYLIAILLFMLFYVIMLCLLVFFESGRPGSHIENIGDAFWYSLVTFSTVGYGDVTPVTPHGHVIGVIFLLMSMGFLVAMFGSVVSFLTSEGFPLMKLRFLRYRNWHYLADFTSESDALARDILREDENAVIIYGINKDEVAENPDYPCFFLNVSPARIVAQKKDAGEKCNVYFLKENDIGKNIRAIDIHALPVNVYACTASGREKMSGNIHFFHAYDCCARCYWREHPLDNEEDEIVIIGFGNYGKAILERAIMININDTDFDVSYHIFGDYKKFLEIHKNLDLAFGINERKEGFDSLYFHDEDWTEAHDVIAKANRIVICEDDEETGWDDLWQLQRYYRVKCRIDLRSSRKAPGVSYFGTYDQIFTVDQIIRTKINEAAIAMNDLYRESVPDSLDWDELSDQLKQSKISAADHLFMKVRMLLNGQWVSAIEWENCQAAYEAYCEIRKDPAAMDKLRRIEHARWVRFYTYYNWTYGTARNDTLRESPMLCEYERLSEADKAHHDRAWELIGEIARLLRRYN